jgi:hypothetical protein
MPFTVSAKNLMLDALFGLPLYASLHSDVPNSSGSNELTGGSPAYARKSIAFLDAASGEVSRNPTPVVTFDIPAGSAAAFVGLWSADTGGTFHGYAPTNGGILSNVAMAYVASNNLFCPGAGGLSAGNQVLLTGINGVLPLGLLSTQLYTVTSVLGDTFALNTTIGADGPVAFQRVAADVFGVQGTVTIDTCVFGFNG